MSVDAVCLYFGQAIRAKNFYQRNMLKMTRVYFLRDIKFHRDSTGLAVGYFRHFFSINFVERMI